MPRLRRWHSGRREGRRPGQPNGDRRAVTVPTESAEPTVWTDLATAITAWRVDPRLPLVTLVVAAVPGAFDVVGWSSDNAAAGLLAMVVGLAVSGWEGAIQVWYRRIWTGRSISPGEAARLSWAFLGRFIVFGFVAGFPLTLTLPLVVGGGRPAGKAIATALSLLWLAALVFVSPVLTFTTRRVGVGVPRGLRLLRDGWPATGAYAGVAVLADASRVTPIGGVAVSAGRLLIGTLAHLALAGAVAAWYLRRARSGDDGAAYETPPERPVRPTKRRRR